MCAGVLSVYAHVCLDWHTKDNWSGFTFDGHIFPFAADDMGWLNKKGLIVTLNLHDASGVNNWDAMFPELLKSTGGDPAAKKVAMNLVNASVTYAVEDIVLGDLLNDKQWAAFKAKVEEDLRLIPGYLSLSLSLTLTLTLSQGGGGPEDDPVGAPRADLRANGQGYA